MSRRPKPSALHRLHSTRPHQRVAGTGGPKETRSRRHEPTTPVGAPPMPASVTADDLAQRHWAQFAALLLEMQVLTPRYGAGLALLAFAQADVDRMRTQAASMNHQAVVVEQAVDATGTTRHRVRSNPIWRELFRAQQTLRLLLTEFGLTPAASARVQVAEPVDDAFDTFLAGPSAVVPFPNRQSR